MYILRERERNHIDKTKTVPLNSDRKDPQETMGWVTVTGWESEHLTRRIFSMATTVGKVCKECSRCGNVGQKQDIKHRHTEVRHDGARYISEVSRLSVSKTWLKNVFTEIRVMHKNYPYTSSDWEGRKE